MEEKPKAKDSEKKELSEDEEKKLQELGDICKRIGETNNAKIQLIAINELITQIKSSTSSVTSIPVVLKLLIDFWDDLKKSYSATPDGENKVKFSNLMAILSMTLGEDGEAIKYKLQGDIEDITTWGYEFVRYMSREIGREYVRRDEDAEKLGIASLRNEDIFDLLGLVDRVVPYLVDKNHEPQAIDLLLEVDRLDSIKLHITRKNYRRVCRYLIECSKYYLFPENVEILKCAYDIHMSDTLGTPNFTEALRVALIMNKSDLILETYNLCKDKQVKRQLAFMLSHVSFPVKDYSLDDDAMDEDEDEDLSDWGEDDDGEVKETESELLYRILNNEMASEHFLYMAKELDILQPKTTEEIFKEHLSKTRQVSSTIDSAKQNLAISYVNSFANAGFCGDKLITQGPTDWVHRNKDNGKIGAAASLGLIFLWNMEEGMNQLDRYLHSTDHHIKAGAILGMGICSSMIRSEEDPCFGIISKYTKGELREVRICSIIGLGIAYAGSRHNKCTDLLLDLVSDEKEPMDIVCFASLALGMLYVGAAKHEDADEVLNEINNVFASKERVELDGPFSKFLCLSLGLMYLGLQEKCEEALTVAATYDGCISKFLAMTIETCAYAGSGNVLKIQQLVSICGEHLQYVQEEKDKEFRKKLESEEPREDPKEEEQRLQSIETKMKERKENREKLFTEYQSVACLGIALVAMGEDIGTEMAGRVFNHILHYADPHVKKAVPMALALLNVSNPKLEVMDVLSKMSHDSNNDVAMAAILGLGIIGAGTQNARLTQMLRSLAEFYAKDPNHVYMTRIAQGLIHLGKGLLTLSPFVSDRKVMKTVAMAGLLPVIFSAMELRTTLIGPFHFMLYYIAPALSSRMFMTLDDNMKPLPIPVRVGQAVDTVAKAGERKTITGFQTHDTPVTLQFKERAEIATEKYISMVEILEGAIILKKAPKLDEKN